MGNELIQFRLPTSAFLAVRACWATKRSTSSAKPRARNQSHGEVTAIDPSPDHTRGNVQTPRDLGLRNPRRVRLSYSRISGKKEWLIQSPAEYNASRSTPPSGHLTGQGPGREGSFFLKGTQLTNRS